MKEFAIYSLQANVLIVLSYLCYRLMLNNESAFKANRTYLLIAAVVSLVAPLIRIPTFFSPQLAAVNLGEVVISRVGTYVDAPAHPSYNYLPEVLYFSGFCIASVLFVKNILQIFFIINKGRVVKREGYVIVQSEKTEGIFSFLKFIVIPAGKEYSEGEIMQHELTHVNQLHSLDVLFFEIIALVFWYNPICYLYKVAVKENHEFLADNAVIKEKNDPVSYAKLITSHALDVTPYTLSDNFIRRSMLKRRIIMLGKAPSGVKRFVVKYGFTAILLGATIMLSSFLKSNDTKSLTAPAAIPVKNNEVVYSQADKMPKFSGNLGEFLNKTIKYPKDAGAGVVYLSFVVRSNGDVTDAQVIKSSNNKDLDAEALRAVNAMPAWIPGEKDGKKVNVSFKLPIAFRLK